MENKRDKRTKLHRFSCVIYYTKGCEQYISEFQDKKVSMLRKHCENLTAEDINHLCKMLENKLINGNDKVKGQSV